ncbi:hypothetical protein [Leuconostoc mesenteroides]|uniref:hypothetical protein n=1 Tax=Leuconostoc mesenteroides TaxID=1245 RepID=UPI0023628896|nr:hypothetical protein [Leuconostoc mesenteroides]
MISYLHIFFSYVVPVISVFISLLAYRSSNFPVKVLKTHRPILYSFGVMNSDTSELPTGNKGLIVIELLIQNLRPNDVSFFELSVTDSSNGALLHYLSQTRLEVFSDDIRGLLVELDRIPTILPLRLPYADYGLLPAGRVTALQLVCGVNDQIPEKINVSLKLPHYKFGLIASNKEFNITKTLNDEQVARFTKNLGITYQEEIKSAL